MQCVPQVRRRSIVWRRPRSGDKARVLFRRDGPGHEDRACMFRVLCLQQRHWRSNPRGRCGSPIEDGVFVPGARFSSTAAPGAYETKDRMVVRKRGYGDGAALSCSCTNRGRLDETTSAPAYAREHAALNQPPDGRAGNAQRSSRFLHRNHRCSHARIVSHP